MRPARRHRDRLSQWALLACEGVPDPRIQAAARLLEGLSPDQAVRCLALAVSDTLAYIPEVGEQLATVEEVLDRGGDDCDGLAVVVAAIGLALRLPVELVMFRQPGDEKATHVAARVAGHLVDPTPPAAAPWQLASPGPLKVCCGC